MESLSKNPVLEFNKNTLEDVRRLYDLDKPGRMKEAVDILDKWVKEQKHFTNKDFPLSYLENTILLSKGSLERSKHRLDKMCTYRTLLPHFFGDFDLREDFKEMQEGVTFSYLPKLTPDHYRVLLAKVSGDRWHNSLMLQLGRLGLIYSEYLKMHECSAGFIIIIDYRDLDIVEHVRHVNLVDTKQAISIVMEGVGVRIKGIHMITSSKYIELIINLLKQGLSAKLSERIQVHTNLESLHDCLKVPKEIFPIEYGGKEKSLKELQDKWTEILSSKENKEFQRMMNDSKTDEASREGDIFTKEYMGMPGTFRTLSVD